MTGYPRRVWGKKLLVVLKAYVDDSTSEVGDETFVLAAYVHDADTWDKFTEEWDRVLHESPSIDYLRMVEANSLRDQFRGWTQAARDKKIVELAKVIDHYQPWSFRCSVSRADYKSIIAPTAAYHLQNPYFVCFYCMVAGIPRIHKIIGVDLPVDFIFDEQGGLGLDALMWYDYFKETTLDPEVQRLLGSTPIFRDDKDFIPLQAADMLAWHLRRGTEKRNEELPARKFLTTLPNGHHVIELEKSHLEDWATKLSQVPDVELIKDRRSWRALRPELLRRLASGEWPFSRQDNLFKRFRKWLMSFIRR